MNEWIGPMPLPAGQESEETSTERIAKIREEFARRETGESSSKMKPKEREAWMLEPGSSKITPAQAMKNRGFSSGTAGAAVPDVNEPGIEQYEHQECLNKDLEKFNQENNRGKSLLEKHRAKIAKKAKKEEEKEKKRKKKEKKKAKKRKKKEEKKKKKKGKKSSSSESSSDDEPPKKVYRESFNWDRDMKVNKVDKKHAYGVMNTASALNSKFQSKGLQDKFM